MSKETKEPVSNVKLYIRYAIHMLMTVVLAVGVAWFSNEVILEKAWCSMYFQYAGIILMVIALCSLLERKKLYGTIRSMAIQTACFLVSALLLLLSDYYVNLPVWLLGGIVAAALVSRNIGMLYLYYFVFHAIYLQGNWMNGLVFHFVVATLIAFFIPKMKTFLGMFYLMAFSACAVVTGSVIHNKMCIDDTMLLDTFYILCTYLACIFITMLLVKWSGDKEEQDDEVLVQGNYEYLDLLAKETAEREATLAEQEKQQKEAENVTEAALTEETVEAAVTEEPVATAEEAESAEVTPVEETTSAEETTSVEEAIPAEETTSAEEITPVEETTSAEEITLVEETVADEENSQETMPEENAREDELKTVEEITEETVEEAVVEEIIEEIIEEIDYTPYCDEKAPLLQELRTKSKAAYAQSILVSKLATETAKSIGLDAELTKAGGLYKRIGKIKENSNEYTSTEIAKEHNFPQPLIYLLDQLNHNIIEQKEAALLLITEGVISYYSIVRQVQKNDIAVEKIVDTIVSKKIFQGEFNESGLSMQECFLLREKLIDLLKSQDKRSAAK